MRTRKFIPFVVGACLALLIVAVLAVSVSSRTDSLPAELASSVAAAHSPVAPPSVFHMYLVHAADVSGTTLKPGEYTVRYEVHGRNLKVSFLRDEAMQASARGELVDRGAQFRYSIALIQPERNGKSTLREFQFEGQRIALVLDL
jgi:hypothetical protein